MDSAPDPDIDVLIATPLGRGGHGGVDRLMDSIIDEFQRQGDPSIRVQSFPTRGNRSLAIAPLYFAVFLLRFFWRAIFGRLDVVHLNVSSNGSTIRKLILFNLARALRKKIVLHLHGGEFDEYWANTPPWLKRRINAMFAGADRTIVLGEYWKDIVVSHVPAAAARIVVLHNATPARNPATPSGSVPVVLFLGIIGTRKGTPQLIEALAGLPRDLPWKAILAGNGEVEKARQRVAELGLADRVQFTGWVSEGEVERLLSTSDILVLPSLHENLPMSVIEAMSVGLAVVTTPVGAVPDIIKDGETGLLVPPNDSAALGQVLQRVLSSAVLRHKLGQAAYRFHQSNLRLDVYVRRLAAVWKSVVNGTP